MAKEHHECCQASAFFDSLPSLLLLFALVFCQLPPLFFLFLPLLCLQKEAFVVG